MSTVDEAIPRYAELYILDEHPLPATAASVREALKDCALPARLEWCQRIADIVNGVTRVP